MKKLKKYKNSGLYRAITVVGGASKLAKEMQNRIGEPVTRQRVFQWKKYGRIPSWFLQIIHDITHVPLTDLIEPFEPELSDEEK